MTKPALLIIILTLTSLILTGCTTTQPEQTPTAQEIAQRTIQALTNITSYRFEAHTNSNHTWSNNTKAVTERTTETRHGATNITAKAITFNQTSTSTITPTTRYIYYLVNQTIYIGNETTGTIIWENTSDTNPSQYWTAWSFLTNDALALNGTSFVTATHQNITLTRQPDTTYHNTPCYVLTFPLNTTTSSNITTPKGNYSGWSLHTYLIDKNTYHILLHRITGETFETGTYTFSPSYIPFTATRFLNEGETTITYTDYNTTITITPPITR